VDELLPQTRKLLTLLTAWVKAQCEHDGVDQVDFRFTRRQVREAVGWGDTQLKIHLARLAEMEFLLSHRGKQGQTYAYELLYQGEDGDGLAKLLGLIDCERLQSTAMTTTSRGTASTSRGEEAHFAAPGRGVVGGWSAPGRGAFLTVPVNGDGHLHDLDAHPHENALIEDHAPVLSYPEEVAQ